MSAGFPVLIGNLTLQNIGEAVRPQVGYDQQLIPVRTDVEHITVHVDIGPVVAVCCARQVIGAE